MCPQPQIWVPKLGVTGAIVVRRRGDPMPKKKGPQPKRVGRKPMPPELLKSSPYPLKLSPSEKDMVVMAAALDGDKPAHWGRKAVVAAARARLKAAGYQVEPPGVVPKK